MMTIWSIRLRGTGHLTTRFALVRVADAVLAAFERARQRQHLATLDERMLRDVGLSPAEAYRESAKPFWRG